MAAEVGGIAAGGAPSRGYQGRPQRTHQSGRSILGALFDGSRVSDDFMAEPSQPAVGERDLILSGNRDQGS